MRAFNFSLNLYRLKILFCLALFLFSLSYNLIAQTDKSRTDSVVNRNLKNQQEGLEKQIDIDDLLKKMFKPRPLSRKDSLLKNHKIQFVFFPAAGYSLQTGFSGVASANITFNKNKIAESKYSSITSNIEYSFLYHQLIVPVLSNVWSNNNKYNFLGDWRYYVYPTYTYGLGGRTSLSDASKTSYSFIKINQIILRCIKSDFYAGGGYALDYHFGIRETGRIDRRISDFNKYNGTTRTTVSSGILFNVLYDGRKNVNNPKESVYGSITYRPNFTFLGSDRNWQSLLIDFRKYIKLLNSSNNILALWSYNWFTFGNKLPYLDLPSTGWDKYSTMGRGYIQGRLRGRDLLYMEAEYRFGITHNGLFGGVVFMNAQTVPEWKSKKFEKVYPGTGVGLRIKANKISNVNFDIDYAIGIGGSRGFFFNICEVF